MNLYIDCEFNDFNGPLISLALVADDGREFYEVLQCNDPSPWVAQHVMPILNKKAVSKSVFQQKLYQFLNQFNTIHIIADWPEDISHFCQSLILSPGERLNTPHTTMEILRVDSVSKLPHNALADARGLRGHFKK